MLDKIKHKKINIRRRVLLTLLVCVLVSFLGLGALFLHTLGNVGDSVLEQEGIMAEKLSYRVGDFSGTTIKNRLKDTAEMKALAIDRELYATARNVEMLAANMSMILQHPEKYKPRELPNTREQEDILSGVPYVHCSPRLWQQGVGGLAGEIDMGGNLSDLLLSMSKSYGKNRTSLYVGSRHGYLICLDIVPDGGSIYPSKEYKESFINGYDPVERSWYKLGEGVDKPAYTEVYTGADGYLDVTCVMPYYDNEGLAGVAGISYSIEDMYHQVADDAIGRTGVNFAMDREGRVIFSGLSQGLLAAGGSQDLRQCDNRSLASAAARMTAGGRGVTSVNLYGQDYFLAYAPMSSTGWSFGTLIAKEEVMAPTREIVAEMNLDMEAFGERLEDTFAASALKAMVLALVMFAFAMYLSRRMAGGITEPIYKLREGVREIASGNLQEKVDLQTGDELQELADSFNTMTDNLEEYMEKVARAAEEKERTQTELHTARSIQQSMLPGTLPEQQEFSLQASMKAARDVGGDFYDYYLVDEDHLMVTIADVSGKGVPAALFMARAMTVLRSLAQGLKGESLAGIVARANDELCSNNEAMMFVTAFVAMLDLRDGRLSYVNAGHNPVLVGRTGGGFEFLPVKRNFVLGGIEEMVFAQQEDVLAPGEMLFLYTDGVTEAQSESTAFYGEKHLQEFLNKTGLVRPQALLAAVGQDLARHVGAAEQSDDITMLALKYR